MQVTVFGANGKVGQLAVGELLKQGHDVKAFVHSQNPFPETTHLEIIKGDIYSATDVARAVKGSEVVMSALGSWGTPKKDILTAAMQNIIPAMDQAKIKRIISLTGHEAKSRNDPKSLLHPIIHWVLKTVRFKILTDGDEHIRLLENSELDWTVIRSPVMTERGDVSNFSLADHWPQPWETIHRQSVALAMVAQLKQTEYINQAPFIVRK